MFWKEIGDGEMKKSAEKYLKFWHCEDSDHCNIFANSRIGWCKQRENELRNAMDEYKILRNFPKKCESGKRFELVFGIMDEIADISNDNFVSEVEKCARKFQEKYGKYLLSAASKLLWFKCKSPIIIYDNNVRKHLKTAEGDYRTYCERWRAEYAEKENAIDAACADLAEVYPSDKGVICEKWFKERVFDFCLWENDHNDTKTGGD